MTKNPYAIAFSPCAFEDVQEKIAKNIRDLGITVDSFWEDHVLESRHYQMAFEGEYAGYFAIHGGSTITLFWVEPQFARLSQALFARIKKQESVTCALTPTGDEFLLSHCVDDFARLEKQAYFAIYASDVGDLGASIELKELDASNPADCALCELSGDFLTGEMEQIRNGKDVLHIFSVWQSGEIVGFGVIQYGIVVPEIASIGMYVREEYRRQGLAGAILSAQSQMVKASGHKAISGCWYYNHASKKSMENAGAYSKTRLLRFYF